MIQLSRRFADLSEAKRGLLAQVLRREGVDASLLPIQPRAATVAELPLSYAQQSLWFMCHLASDSAVYNLPSAVRLRGSLDHAALERAFNELIRRHESLRTRFPATSGKPRQEILPALTLRIPRVSCTEAPEAERERRALELANAESHKPFDLNEGPLMRVVVYELGPQDHLVLFVFHHLIWDGWSIGVMTQELAVLYGAFAEGKPSPLPQLPIQFADYALWQREWLAGEALDAQVAWWEEKLRGVEDLRLPTDRPRPALPTFAGGMEFVSLSEELSAALESLSQRAGTTLFMTLLAGFQLLLSRYSEQELVPVGTPIANRRRREVEGLIGYFANILVLATDVSGDPSFTQLLARVKDVTTGAYAHQDIPFELLVDKLRIARDPSRNPLFQVMFAVHQESIGGLSLPGLEQSPVNLGSETTHFDLGLHLWRRSDGLKGYVSYNKDLFEPLTILRLISHFTTLLEAAVRDPERNVSSLPLLSEPERAWLQERARVSTIETPRDVVEVIAERIDQHPEATALVMASPGPGTESRLTYRALGERAGKLARRLQRIEVEREPVVGLLLPPGPDAIAAVLGAWGNAVMVVPFDHRTPREELPALVADAGVTVLVTASGGSEALPPLGCEVVSMDALAEVPPRTFRLARVERSLPAYLTKLQGDWFPVTHGMLAERIARLSGSLELQPGEALLATAPAG
ncbi:MAG TPA: condensation domain-containing protein, partial [Myxococcaceae bacterium]|nr:condensation domain-containing protein [Myxococcaceae bacterium]